jgi:hypothetical protein
MIRAAVLVCIIALPTTGLQSQSPSRGVERVALPAPIHTSPHEFTRVAGVAELDDGSVIASDLAGQDVAVLTPELRLAAGVGRRGQGPNEFTSLGAIFLLRADTAVVEEPSYRRWRLVTPSALLGPIRTELRHSVDIALVGVDGSGRTLEVHPSVFAARATGARPVPIRAFAESLALIRRSRDGSRSDTLASLRGGYLGSASVERTVKGERMNHFLFHPLSAEDQAVSFADGWVAIVRVEPYRVEWILPDGTRRLGPVRTDVARPMTAADRQYAIDSRQSRVFKGVFRPNDFATWPRMLPAFTNGALLTLANGNVLVRRERRRDDPVQAYEEFDRRGLLVRELSVPDGVRLIGSGRHGLYSAIKDSDDVEAISLHPWPGSR